MRQKKKIYTIKDDRIVVSFKDLNDKLKRVARYVSKHTLSSRLNKGGIAIGISGAAGAMSVSPQGTIMTPEGLVFLGAGGILSLLARKEIKTSLNEIKQAYATASRVMHKQGILNKNPLNKDRYGIDLSHKNQSLLEIVYPSFSFDKNMNLVLLKPTAIEKIRIHFQKKTGMTFFGRWHGNTKKTRKKKTKARRNKETSNLRRLNNKLK